MQGYFEVLETNTTFPITRAEVLEYLKLDEEDLSEALTDLYIQSAYNKIQSYIGWSICPRKCRTFVNVKKTFDQTSLKYITSTLLYAPIISLEEVAIHIDNTATVLDPANYSTAPSYAVVINDSTIPNDLHLRIRPVRIEYYCGYNGWDITSEHMYPHYIIRMAMLEEVRALYEECALPDNLLEKSKGILFSLQRITL